MELRDNKGRTEAEFLAAYDKNRYSRPAVAVDMAVFTLGEPQEGEQALELLLVRRGGHPYLGCYALPGGFVQENETVGQAAARELAEETAVEDAYLEQLQVFSDPGRDPRMWVLSAAHVALVRRDSVTLKAGDDAAEAAWFRVSWEPVKERTRHQDDKTLKVFTYELKLTRGEVTLRALIERRISLSMYARDVEYVIVENEGIAFDHAKIIATALVRIRQQTPTWGTIFRLLPELFTLEQLQMAYEAVCGTVDPAELLEWAHPFLHLSMREGYYRRNMSAFLKE